MAKLSAQEIIDSLKEMTLLEIKEVVDLMKEEFGVDPSAVAVAAPAAGGAAAGDPLGGISGGAGAFGALEFYPEPEVYLLLSQQCAGGYGKGGGVLCYFYPRIHLVDRSADRRLRLE